MALMNNSERIKKDNGCAFPSIFGVQILGSTIYFDPNPYEVKYCLCWARFISLECTKKPISKLISEMHIRIAPKVMFLYC